MNSDEDREGASILVVEDEEDARDALVAILETTGYRAVPARNGKEALDYLSRAETPGLIILDLCMPVMDGWQFLRERVKDPRLARVPVVVISALSDRNDFEANEVIMKPVDVDRLLTTVSHYCKQERTA